MFAEFLREVLSARVVPESAINEAAELIAMKMRRMAEGDYKDPNTWIGVAEALGILCQVRQDDSRNACRGASGQVGWPSGTSYIVVNSAYPPAEQAHAWVHEIAHLEVLWWCPPQLQNGADVRCYYDDDPQDVHHRIARRVEALLFPSP